MKKYIPHFFPFRHKKFLIPTAILTAFSLGIGGAYLSTHMLSENTRFERLTDSLFEKEVTASALTLHYTLANPDTYGITTPDPSLGLLNTDTSSALEQCSTYESRLLDFDTEKLSEDNQITRDTLLLYFHTQKQLMSYPLLYEPLSPSLGIQAQLPVLLAEYSFYDSQDVIDYLKLLTTIKPYFESILSYEHEKSAAGYFMSDTTLNRIRSQCNSFLCDPNSCYMQEIFEENLSTLPELSDEERTKLSKYHQNLLKTEVFPAYQSLLDGLETLRGTGNTTHGLAAYPDGAQYYQLLFQSETGVYEPITMVERRLSEQMLADSKQINLMLKEQPSLLNKLKDSSIFQTISPDEILAVLRDSIIKDFPPLTDASPEVRTVHPSMQDYLSPAFYLTPPMDTGTPNVIYINPKNNAKGLELFTTLAHEGFPGHLYQTVSFERKACSPIRYLITTPGYVEGWATYIESWAAEASIPLIHDPAASDIAHLYALNRRVNLCLYTLLDIGIHYRGWNQANVTRFLSVFGLKDPKTVQEIYQYIVENPANYPKYCVGALEFQRLKDALMKKEGDDFSLKDFHQKILSIGPVPFPVLKKYLGLSTKPNNS